MDEITTEIQVTVLFFAKARELVGSTERKICVPKQISAVDLFEKIVFNFNLEIIRKNILLAVNEEFIDPLADLVLSEEDKIAVIPPLSGGLFNNKLSLLCV